MGNDRDLVTYFCAFYQCNVVFRYVGTLGYANQDGNARVNFDLNNQVSGEQWRLDLQSSVNRGEKVGSLSLETPWETMRDMSLDYRLNSILLCF